MNLCCSTVIQIHNNYRSFIFCYISGIVINTVSTWCSMTDLTIVIQSPSVYSAVWCQCQRMFFSGCDCNNVSAVICITYYWYFCRNICWATSSKLTTTVWTPCPYSSVCIKCQSMSVTCCNTYYIIKIYSFACWADARYYLYRIVWRTWRTVTKITWTPCPYCSVIHKCNCKAAAWFCHRDCNFIIARLNYLNNKLTFV